MAGLEVGTIGAIDEDARQNSHNNIYTLRPKRAKMNFLRNQQSNSPLECLVKEQCEVTMHVYT